MEGSHRQLRTRLTNGLSGDDTDRLTDLYSLACRHIGTIALRADTDPAAAGQNRTNLYPRDRIAVRIDAHAHDLLCPGRCNHMICLDQNIAILIANGLSRIPSGDPFLKAFDHFLPVCEL